MQMGTRYLEFLPVVGIEALDLKLYSLEVKLIT
jgi:hypothetical protein